MEFISPTDGRLTLKETYHSVLKFIKDYPEHAYKLIIGTDSQPNDPRSSFVTAIVIYRVGRGGRFFYHRRKVNTKGGFKQRIFYEVSCSLEVASKITRMLSEETDLDEDIEVEIHVDVGENGPTSSIIKEVVGMVVGSGYEALIKPEAYAASSVADKYTR
ncbi:MAG: ribonuclease H-like YkuK family protein [Halarsenatibacteraceae bacterium]